MGADASSVGILVDSPGSGRCGRDTAAVLTQSCMPWITPSLSIAQKADYFLDTLSMLPIRHALTLLEMSSMRCWTNPSSMGSLC